MEVGFALRGPTLPPSSSHSRATSSTAAFAGRKILTEGSWGPGRSFGGMPRAFLPGDSNRKPKPIEGLFLQTGLRPSKPHKNSRHCLSCSVTREKREPFLGKTIFSGAATYQGSILVPVFWSHGHLHVMPVKRHTASACYKKLPDKLHSLPWTKSMSNALFSLKMPTNHGFNSIVFCGEWIGANMFA